jgi:hypothetical protein
MVFSHTNAPRGKKAYRTLLVRSPVVALACSVFLAGAATSSGRFPVAPDASDLRICRRLAGPEGATLTPLSQANFDLNGDGQPEHLEIVPGSGTWRTYHPQVTWSDGRTSELDDDSIELIDEDWRWSEGARWLLEGGRAYVLHYSGTEPTYLRYLGRVDGLKESPMCRFSPRAQVTLKALRPADQRICDEVASGRMRYLQPTLTPRRDPAPAPTDWNFTASVRGRVRVDFENAGAPTDLYLMEAGSTAGSGCTLQYFDTTRADQPSPARAQIMAMQRMEVTEEEAYPRRTCRDAQPRWFSFQGKQYLETKAERASSPRHERDEYHWVDILDDGKPRQVCEARYQHQPPRLVGAWYEGWGPTEAVAP